MTDDDRLRSIWNQGVVPVLLNRGQGERARLRLPLVYGAAYAWLRRGRRRRPDWNVEGRYWEVPRAWFSDLVSDCIARWGSVYVIQPYREHQKCAPACWDAEGDICECSCMGANHGLGRPGGGWLVLSDTFAVQWGEQRWACRLLGAQSVPEARWAAAGG